MPLHSDGPGNICAMGYHRGLLNGHHGLLSPHGARQASGGDIFIPSNKLIFYGDPEKNKISGQVPVIHSLSAGQGFGMPHVQTNEFYKPRLWFNVTGINRYPTTRLWGYPGVVHATGVKGFHGTGLGMYYGTGTPQQYSKGIYEPHAGWTSAFRKFNNVHGTAGVRNYNLRVDLNEFQRTGIQGGEIKGLFVRGIPWHYGEVVGHGAMGVTAMGIHNGIPISHEGLSPGYGNTMTGDHAGINKGYQELANDHNPELHNVMHVDGTGIYHGRSGYHGNGYHGMNGYHRGGYSGGGHHGGGYYGGSYHRGKYYGSGYHGMSGYNGGGYDSGGYNGGGYHTGGYHRGEYHGTGYNGDRHEINGYHRGGYPGVDYQGGGYHGSGYYGNRYGEAYNIMNGYHGNEDHGINGYYGSEHHKSGIKKHHGSFNFGDSLQATMSNEKGNKMGDKLEADQNSKSLIFKEETHFNQDKQDYTQNNGRVL
jgi:hypothetical protein